MKSRPAGLLKGFVDHPARLGYIVMVILLNAVAAIRIPEVGKKRTEPRIVVHRQHLTVVLMQVITILIVIVAPYCDRRGTAVLVESGTTRYLGLAMYAVGFLMMHWAEASLGKLFTMEVSIQEGQTLVTNGPYRYLRHPRYLGVDIFVFGISLLYLSWPGLILSVAMTLVLLWRIHDEEAFMSEEFGPDWEAYCRRSWRVIPFVF